MNAASIIETFGRGIPATLDTSMIVDVCAYLRSTQSPAVLVLTSRGELRGVLSHRDIIHASGRLGSSVMQMMAQELMRDQVPVCQSGDGLIELLELVTETGSDFALVAEGSQIKGLVTVQDLTELLVTALGGGEANADAAQPEQPVTQPSVPDSPPQQVQAQPPAQAQEQPLVIPQPLAFQPQPQPQAMPEQMQPQPQPLAFQLEPQPQAMPEPLQPQPQPQAVQEQMQPQPQPQQGLPAGQWYVAPPQVQHEPYQAPAADAAPPPQQGQWPSPYPSVPDVPPAAAFAPPGQPAPLPSHHAGSAGMHQLQPQHMAFPTQQQQLQPQPAAAPAAWATFNS